MHYSTVISLPTSSVVDMSLTDDTSMPSIQTDTSVKTQKKGRRKDSQLGAAGVLGLLSIWNVSFLGYPTRVVSQFHLTHALSSNYNDTRMCIRGFVQNLNLRVHDASMKDSYFLLRCPLITSIWVYGNSFESFLVVVVVPKKKVLEDWAAKNNEAGEFEVLC